MAEKEHSLSCTLHIVKLIAIAISVGLSFFFFMHHHGGWKQVTESIKEAASILLPEMEEYANIYSKGSEQCDLFIGKWVQNNWGPEYTNNTCKFIYAPNDCLGNGRPDKGYLYWSWKPDDCGVIPPLDAKRFMHSMRNKSWAFIGDSVVRNQMESLVCILSQVEEPYAIYDDLTYITKKVYFPSYNITLATVFVPFLVKYSTLQNKQPQVYLDTHNIYSTSQNEELQVYLDTLDEQWTEQYHKYDYVMIANGQWYLRNTVIWEHGKVIGCHNCRESFDEIGIAYSYRTALRLAFDFISSQKHKPLVFFRTWTPCHFEHRELNGGYCNRTKPYSEEYKGDLFDEVVRGIEVDEFEKVVTKMVHMELLDTFRLSLLRPDGHPGRYGNHYPKEGAEVESDCLHSCLPGPVDTWNDLMMKLLLRKGIVSFSEN